jgi:glycosyltransferase involved in cell wall biosynthesis
MVNYSIIIPHYNIPDLLMRCLKSIPVREDIQVIVVDDCSPEADKYLEKYPELTTRPYLEYYSSPIGGSAGRARNIGLDHAKGTWLIFLDADDFLIDNAETILDESVNRKEDILFYNSKSVMSDDVNKKSNRNFYAGYFTKYAEDHNKDRFRYTFGSLWGKIIRHSIATENNIRFDETRYSNDVTFSTLTGYYAKDIAIIDKPFFVITERSGSLASSQFKNSKISLQECRQRFHVSLKNHATLEKYGVKAFSDQIEYAYQMRKFYPKEYVKEVLQFAIANPSCACKLGSKRIKQFFRNFRSHIS